MKILIVEDDEFKATDLLKVLSEYAPVIVSTRAASVTSALKMISEEPFDTIILDMSLPTFDLSGPGGGGSPQGQGGIEVLRLASKLSAKSSFIIATQYPDIDIEGGEVPLNLASRRLQDRFKLPIIDCILYEFDGHGWRDTLRYHIAKLLSAL